MPPFKLNTFILRSVCHSRQDTAAEALAFLRHTRPAKKEAVHVHFEWGTAFHHKSCMHNPANRVHYPRLFICNPASSRTPLIHRFCAPAIIGDQRPPSGKV